MVLVLGRGELAPGVLRHLRQEGRGLCRAGARADRAADQQQRREPPGCGRSGPGPDRGARDPVAGLCLPERGEHRSCRGRQPLARLPALGVPRAIRRPGRRRARHRPVCMPHDRAAAGAGVPGQPACSRRARAAAAAGLAGPRATRRSSRRPETSSPGTWPASGCSWCAPSATGCTASATPAGAVRTHWWPSAAGTCRAPSAARRTRLTYTFDGQLVEGETPGDLTPLEITTRGQLVLARGAAPRVEARASAIAWDACGEPLAGGFSEWRWRRTGRSWSNSGWRPLRHAAVPAAEPAARGARGRGDGAAGHAGCPRALAAAALRLRERDGPAARQPPAREQWRRETAAWVGEQIQLAESTQAGLAGAAAEPADSGPVTAALAEFRLSITRLLQPAGLGETRRRTGQARLGDARAQQIVELEHPALDAATAARARSCAMPVPAARGGTATRPRAAPAVDARVQVANDAHLAPLVGQPEHLRRGWCTCRDRAAAPGRNPSGRGTRRCRDSAACCRSSSACGPASGRCCDTPATICWYMRSLQRPDGPLAQPAAAARDAAVSMLDWSS